MQNVSAEFAPYNQKQTPAFAVDARTRKVASRFNEILGSVRTGKEYTIPHGLARAWKEIRTDLPNYNALVQVVNLCRTMSNGQLLTEDDDTYAISAINLYPRLNSGRPLEEAYARSILKPLNRSFGMGPRMDALCATILHLNSSVGNGFVLPQTRLATIFKVSQPAISGYINMLIKLGFLQKTGDDYSYTKSKAQTYSLGPLSSHFAA